jgi:hypothetical protein
LGLAGSLVPEQYCGHAVSNNHGHPENNMRFFKFTSDPIVRRLRWLMLFTILFDGGLTLLGQPASYWRHPETVLERNVIFHYVFAHGAFIAIVTMLIYTTAVFMAACLLQRRWALSIVMFFAFVHYFGACTWLDYHWRFGTKATAFYAVPLSVIFVWLAFPASAPKSNQGTPDNSLQAESDGPPVPACKQAG